MQILVIGDQPNWLFGAFVAKQNGWHEWIHLYLVHNALMNTFMRPFRTHSSHGVNVLRLSKELYKTKTMHPLRNCFLKTLKFGDDCNCIFAISKQTLVY